MHLFNRVPVFGIIWPMKLSDHKPQWGTVLKQEDPSLCHPNLAPDFCERATLLSVDGPINGDPSIVTINVKHPDYRGVVAGDLETDSKEAQQRLYELLRTNLGL